MAATPSRVPLRAVRVDPGDRHDEFPFSVPAIGAFRELSLAAPVTFLVGAVLGRALRLVWNRRTRRGFFLCAEDFFGLVKDVNAKLARISTPHTSSVAGLASRHGADADAGATS